MLLNRIFIVGEDQRFDLVTQGLKMKIFHDADHPGFEWNILIKRSKCPAP